MISFKLVSNYISEYFELELQSETAPTPPGTMSLRERMKMFESQDKSSRVPAREIVTQGERASDIRNKINLWGQSNASTNYQVRPYTPTNNRIINIGAHGTFLVSRG